MSKKTTKTNTSFFPSNSRIIAELVARVHQFLAVVTRDRRKTVVLVVGYFLLIAIIITGGNLYMHIQTERKLIADRQRVFMDISKWQGISNQYPQFRDAYFRLAVLSYELRDWQGVENYLEKALLIDPNYEPALKLQNLAQKYVKE